MIRDMNFAAAAAAIHIRSAPYTYPARRFVKSYSGILFFIVTLPFYILVLPIFILVKWYYQYAYLSIAFFKFFKNFFVKGQNKKSPA